MFRVNRLLFGKCVIFLFFVFAAVALWAQEDRDFDLLYPELQRPVYDMIYSDAAGISEYGLVFAIPGMNAGIAYYTYINTLEMYSIATNLGAVSVASDGINPRIFAAFGCGSNSDGLYEFDLSSHEFDLIGWYMNPKFVKKLDSGFYFGYGYATGYGGLLFSEDGDIWSEISYFNGLCVTDIEQAAGEVLFASAGNFIYLKDEETWTSYEVPVVINDIYVRNYPYNEEVYIACGDGTDSDAVYRVEYAEGEISGLTLINWFFEPYRLYEYEEMLVVGCLNDNGLFLVEPEEMSEPEEIGAELDFTEVYCFETYPIYTPNFIMGTDVGIYLVTNLGNAVDEELIIDNGQWIITNYPNPFNPSTRIEFELARDAEVDLAIYNFKGQMVKRLMHGEMSSGKHFVDWDGLNGQDGQNAGSGIYLVRLEAGGQVACRKIMMIK
ncbi:MAG: T9SS type A sorting domain-containing protein [Candidatus Cloacimonetes bacterium]|nr:T9SS type A sorting domain-containing protein [Candidatus Cloacimonadota bacterium]